MTDRPARISPVERIALAVALAVFGWVAWATWWHAGVDMYASYLPWFKHIRATGPVAAFAAPFGSYAPPYLYLLALATPVAGLSSSFAAVKLVSYAGHLLLALATRRLVAAAGGDRPWLAAAAVLVAPSLLINPAVLIQCDAWWAAALVMALAAALRRRPAAMFLWCGLAAGFKLQAAFAAPLFLALALAGRAPWRSWAAAPAGYALTLLPAWLAGWPIIDLLSIYAGQVGFTDRLSLAAPNIWALVELLPVAPPPVVGTIGLAVAAAASLAFSLVFARRLRDAEPIDVLRAACLCALLVPGLLPRMHERYFFLADVLTLALAVMRPRWWPVALMVQFGSFAAIWTYLTGAEELLPAAALAMMAATWLVLRAPASGAAVPADRPGGFGALAGLRTTT